MRAMCRLFGALLSVAICVAGAHALASPVGASKAGPDLTVSTRVVFDPAQPETGQPPRISTVILNIGSASVEQPFWVALYALSHVGTQLVRAPIDSVRVTQRIAAQDSIPVTFTWADYARPDSMRIAADSHNDTEEANENNNWKEFSVPYPDLTVESLRFAPPQQVANRPAGILATVRNAGATTARPFKVGFFVDGVAQTPVTVSGLAADGSIPVWCTSWVATPGPHVVRAFADSLAVVAESNEDNNTLQVSAPVPLPDLAVRDIAWSPTNPVDGQAVTFWAEVVNLGSGGNAASYTVKLKLTTPDSLPADSTMVTVYDDVALGLMAPAFTNADFESHDWTNWSSHSGWSLAVTSSDSTLNRYFASASLAGKVLQSAPFTVTDSTLTFRGMSQSPNDAAFAVYSPSGTPLRSTSFGAGVNETQMYTLDLSDYIGTDVYIRVVSGVSAGNTLVDDIRIGTGSDPLVVAFPSRTWTAAPGTWQISATANPDSAISESSTDNNSRVEGLQVEGLDLTVESLRFAPPQQIANRPAGILATLRNAGTATTRTFQVGFWVDGVAQTPVSVNGMAAGASIPVWCTSWVPTPGPHVIRAFADSTQVVAETNEDNNTMQVSAPVPLPDLAVRDISWSPASPVDGQTVTFWAEVVNRGPGGNAANYTVKLKFANPDTSQTDSTMVTVYDDVALGLMSLAFTNADFESHDWTNWTNHNGWSLAATSSDSTLNHYFASASLAGQVLQSAPFAVTDSTLTFRGMSQSPNDAAFAVYPQGGTTALRSTSFGAGVNETQMYTLDLSDYIGTNVYVRVVSGVSAGNTRVDDIRLGTGSEPLVVAFPSRTWIAAPGTWQVNATANPDSAVSESNTSNNSRVEALQVEGLDLTVESLRFAPPQQMANRPAGILATVRNEGTATARPFKVGFCVDGVAQTPVTVNGMASGASVPVWCTSWVATPGPHVVRAFADSTQVVAETNEDNNTMQVSAPVPLPDLAVRDISWSPANPVDGQAVTFWAEVVNLGPGGNAASYTVKLKLATPDTLQADSTMVTVYDDVALGLMAPAFTNADLESHDWTNWTSHSGWSLTATSSDSTLNHYFASASLAGKVLQSAPFAVTDSTLTFRGMSQSPNDAAFAVYSQSGTPLRSTSFGAGVNETQMYTLDLSDYIGTNVYVRVVSGVSAGNTRVDDIRLGTGNDSLVVAFPSRTWTAAPGTWQISATANPDSTVSESDTSNNSRVKGLQVEGLDLTMESLRFAPPQQVANRPAGILATVRNEGTATARQFKVGFWVDGVAQTPVTVNGLGAGSTIPVWCTSWAATPGSHVIRAFADSTRVVAESNEDNNTLQISAPVLLPDLAVHDIHWSPAIPVDGQTVTFWAEIVNLGPGGNAANYKVQLKLENLDTSQADTATVTVYDDVALGLMSPAFTNADFESHDWTNWTSHGGWSLVANSSDSTLNHYFASASVAGQVLQSAPFAVTDSVLTFRGTSQSPNDAAFAVYSQSGTPLRSTSFGAGSNKIQTFILDLSDYIGTNVYVRVVSGVSAGNTRVDDIRLGTGSDPLVVAFPSRTWIATPGNWKISATANPDSLVAESSAANNSRVEGLQIEGLDLTVESLRFAPPQQVANRPAGILATVRNAGTATTRPFKVGFFVDGVAQTPVTVNGLGAGASVPVWCANWAATPGPHVVRAFADSTQVVAEMNEDNNNMQVNAPVALPDLAVRDIYWSPVNPVDGQMVTFWAELVNLGPGGNAANYTVKLKLENVAASQTDSAMVTVYDDVALGLMSPAFTNADFESHDWTNWTNHAGWSLTGTSSDSTLNHYAASASLAGQVLQSAPFAVTDSTLTFRGISKSPNDAAFAVYTQGGTPLRSTSFGAGISEIQTFTLDLSDYIGTNVYIRVVSGVSAGVTRVDDIRIGTGSDPLVVAFPSRTWTAAPGTWQISATANPDSAVSESNTSNNSRAEGLQIEGLDLSVESLRFAPPQQVANRPAGILATVRNAGTATTRPFQVGFWVDGLALTPVTVNGMGAGASIPVWCTSWAATPGPHLLRAFADSTRVVTESNEDNNTMQVSAPVPMPDLAVHDIYWLPANPVDGQTVTFWAEIVNLAAGGNATDYSVKLKLTNLDTSQADSTMVTVYDDVALGLMSPAFANADFESDDWTNWPSHAGWSLVGASPGSTLNRYLASASLAGKVLQSAPFAVTDSTLTFRGASQSPNDAAFAVYSQSGTPLRSTSFGAGLNETQAFVLDLSDYIGTYVYVRVISGVSAGMTRVDDIRLGTGSDPLVVAFPSRTWTAAPGNWEIRVTANTDSAIHESNASNNSFKACLGEASGGDPDLVVTSLRYSPPGQIASRAAGIVATVHNGGGSITSPFQVGFWVDGTAYAPVTVSGLAAGSDSLVLFRGWTALPGAHRLRAFADSTRVQTESNESNNAMQVNASVAMPDLAVRDIYWSPADPVNGQRTTFWAEIVNFAAGASATNYTVKLKLQNMETSQVDSTMVTVYDDVAPGNMPPAFANADFEAGDLAGWSSHDGWSIGGYSGHPPTSRNHHYAESSSGAQVLQSNPFVVTDGTLTFRGTSQFADDGTFAVYPQGSTTPLQSIKFGSSRFARQDWQAYSVDLSAHLGTSVFVRVQSGVSWARVDDLRMGTDDDSVVVAFPAKPWVAKPGTWTITAVVNTSGALLESDAQHNSRSRQFCVGCPSAAPPRATLQYALLQNQPNPFNPTTTIGYELPEPAAVRLTIHSADGRLVREIEYGRREAGRYQVTWNGRDSDERPVVAGVYFYTLKTSHFRATKKMILLK